MPSQRSYAIMDMYESGKTKKEVSAHFGISYQQVYNITRELGERAERLARHGEADELRGLNTRTRNALCRIGVRTIAELRAAIESGAISLDNPRLINFGVKGMEDIAAFMQSID